MCVVGFLWSVAASAHASPQRIVSLKPNITEILFALGAGERVVGVTTWCDVPDAAKALPKVADYVRPNLEAILALRPDLILAARENTWRAPLDRLRRIGYRVEIVDVGDLQSLPEAITTIGTVVERTSAAAALNATLSRELAPPAIAAPRPRVLMLVGHHPPVVAGPGSYLHGVLELAGGDNVVTTAAPAYPHVSAEQLLASRADVLIDLATTMEGAAPDRELMRYADRVIPLPIDLFRPGPRIGAAVRALREALQVETAVHHKVSR